jgi:hypothetical protein
MTTTLQRDMIGWSWKSQAVLWRSHSRPQRATPVLGPLLHQAAATLVVLAWTGSGIRSGLAMNELAVYFAS